MNHPPFEDIVAEHGSTVLRVCRAVLGSVDADDAWSETFLAALKAYPRLRPDSNVKAWLVTIAHRKALNEKRAESRRPATLEDLPERLTTEGIPGNSETDLWAALKALPPKQRQSVAYHYLAGLPYAEVATILVRRSPPSWAARRTPPGERLPMASPPYARPFRQEISDDDHTSALG